MEIKLNLDLREVELALGSLANLPYAQSAQLIEKIRGQAQSQVEPQKDETDVGATPA